jgi:peptide-methionine (S)-S-oxide reductase
MKSYCNTYFFNYNIIMKKLFIQLLTIFNIIILFPIASSADNFIYSGGCFWCTEADTEKLNGVSEVISGFTGGTTQNPKYIPGKWGDHREAALVIYDPNVISFKDLVLNVFKTIDYEDNDGQFCDRGRSYSPAIYYKTIEEKKIILSLAPKSSIVPIEAETKFFPVRLEHQDYYKKQNYKYEYYRFLCGRDKRIKSLTN